MNDLATLKRALDAPPDYTPTELDLGQIVRSGGRLQRRRRYAAGTAAAAAVVAVLAAGSALVPGAPRPAGDQAMTPATARPSASPATDGEPSGPVGSVIDTGLPTAGGRWVLYAVRVSDYAHPDVPFGIMLGVRRPSGLVEPSVVINEVEGSALAPGFHEGEAAQQVGGRDTLTFGYYVGKPYRIRAKVDGRQVSAHIAAWSENPSVTMFWFSPADARPDSRVTGLAAYDRAGGKLPAGHPGFGVG